jgi:NADH-quinone oxidoreductase subunit E
MKLKVLSEKIRAAVEAEFSKYPDKKSVVLFALRAVQEEEGYISEDAMVDVATLLGLTPVQVWDVATFYTMYNLKPVGKYLIQVCKTLSCAIVGAGGIVDHLKRRLGIGVGETTADGLFSIKLVECLASCGSGPMIQINDDYYEQLTPEKVDRILGELRREGRSPLATGKFRLPMVKG